VLGSGLRILPDVPSPSQPWQKEQLHTKGRPFRGMSEEEVFTEVANLFRGQEDLLSEFGQFLPEAKRSLVSEGPVPRPAPQASAAGQAAPGLPCLGATQVTVVTDSSEHLSIQAGSGVGGLEAERVPRETKALESPCRP
jgi:histone deacetylase complex regulatory component SIN3